MRKMVSQNFFMEADIIEMAVENAVFSLEIGRGVRGDSKKLGYFLFGAI
jgi:hypothetical protein